MLRSVELSIARREKEVYRAVISVLYHKMNSLSSTNNGLGV